MNSVLDKAGLCHVLRPFAGLNIFPLIFLPSPPLQE